MRTPLGQVRGFGSARQGTGHFVRQRLSAIANVPLILAFIVIIISVQGVSHAEVVAILASPVVAFSSGGRLRSHRLRSHRLHSHPRGPTGPGGRFEVAIV